MMMSFPDREVMLHHLRLFGVAEAPALLIRPNAADLDAALAQAHDTLIAVQPETAACARLGISVRIGDHAPELHRFKLDEAASWSRLRSLYPAATYEGNGVPVVHDVNGRTSWLWLPAAGRKVMVIGTDLAGDLVRYRQGDPTQLGRQPAEQWGFPSERPNYLFAAQRQDESPETRHADHWAMALAVALERLAGFRRAPILPGGAKGAVVLTGDDDQAYLEKYAAQQALLGRTPITYFLHPQTRHNRSTLRRLAKGGHVDLGLHPDALDEPSRYGEIFSAQAAWFRELTGRDPVSVRNHGFLNDGYWGHLGSWLDQGIAISANIPGMDGTVVNGSLLPARVAMNGTLTHHWSVLTAFGDGMVPILGIAAEEAAWRIRTYAEAVRQSGLPGVLVFNLHPQNVTEMAPLHRAVLDVINSGFLSWSIRDCLDWFSRRDRAACLSTPRPVSSRLKVWTRSRAILSGP